MRGGVFTNKAVDTHKANAVLTARKGVVLANKAMDTHDANASALPAAVDYRGGKAERPDGSRTRPRLQSVPAGGSAAGPPAAGAVAHQPRQAQRQAQRAS